MKPRNRIGKPAIVQFWDGEPPGDVLKLMETWRTGPCSRSFRYERFDDAAASEFIRLNFDQRTVDAFRQCAVPAMRADFFRYCYLHKNGGIYVDADMACLRNLRELCKGLDRGLLFTRPAKLPRKGFRIPNGFMIITNKEDRLLAEVLSVAIKNIENRISNSVWDVTGPGIMTKLHNQQNRETSELFAGFKIVSEKDVRKFVNFCGGLSYKTSDRHWTIAQKSRSIFVD